MEYLTKTSMSCLGEYGCFSFWLWGLCWRWSSISTARAWIRSWSLTLWMHWLRIISMMWGEESMCTISVLFVLQVTFVDTLMRYVNALCKIHVVSFLFFYFWQMLWHQIRSSAMQWLSSLLPLRSHIPGDHVILLGVRYFSFHCVVLISPLFVVCGVVWWCGGMVDVVFGTLTLAAQCSFQPSSFIAGSMWLMSKSE